MDKESPLKEGFLHIPTQSALLKKKTYQKRFCKLFKSSKHGLERLEVFETEGDSWKNTVIKILTLDNCIKVALNPQKNQPLQFSILAKAYTQDLVAMSELDLHDWVAAVQSVAFNKGSEEECRLSSLSNFQEFEESNELYCSANEGVFTVQIVPTPVSTRWKLNDPNYTLVVTQSTLQLRTAPPSERLLFTWPFMYIRRYGYRNGILSFDAGRKCETGEGNIQLKTETEKGIFQCIQNTMKNWRKFLKTDELSVPSPPVIACGDSQFQAALSMEPGSRTPLPPSPTTATNPSMHIISELSNVFDSSSSKQKPRKPPRKVNLSPPTHQLGKEYDEVETISQAWRTMGVDDFTHTDNITDDHVELSFNKRSNVFKEEAPSQPRKFITQPSVESLEDYDTLNHFGAQSANLIRFSNERVYSQVNDSMLVSKTKEPPEPVSWNEYDFIGESLQESARQADDSHLGYGSIRKVSPQPPEYAEVSKPKKV